MGVFGGTFDPIHLGHLSAAADAAFQLHLDRVLFVPNHLPPHKSRSDLSPVADRVAMVELATADDGLFEVSLIELERAGPSYTLHTLRALRHQFPSMTLYFLAGSDVVPELHAWHEPSAILEEFRVAIMSRPGENSIDWKAAEQHFPDLRRRLEVVPVAQLDISSSDIRQRVAARRPFMYHVTPPVAVYIAARGLYCAPHVG